MSTTTLYKITNVTLRLLNTLLKSILILIIANILTVNELGIFGTILAICTLSVYLLGWELWYIYNRELSAYYFSNPIKTALILRDQFVSYAILYLVILPNLSIYLALKYPDYWFLIIIIIITLHFSQEISRVYSHIEMHLLASLNTLLVQSAWIPIIFYYYLNDVKLSIFTLLKINAFISILFTFITLLLFLKMLNIKLKFSKDILIKVPIIEIIHNIFRTTKLLFSVLFFLLGVVGGRFVLDWLGFIEENGVYSYFQNIASVSMVILNFGLTAIILPKLIKSKQKPKEHSRLIHDFFDKTIKYSIFIYLLMSLIAYLYLSILLKKDIFIEKYYIFLAINIGYMLINIGTFYGSLLYVWKSDNELIYANIASFFAILPFFGTLFVLNKPLIITTTIFIAWAFLNLIIKKYMLKQFFLKKPLINR